MSISIDVDSVDRLEVAGESRATPVNSLRSRAQRLEHAMASRGVRTNQLDKLAGLGDGWTSRFLNEKKKNPGIDKVQSVCDALRISFEWLMSGTGEMEAVAKQDGATTSTSRILTPITSTRWHGDVEATVRLWRTRKKWSDAALALADEIARSRHIEPERWPEILDELETKLSPIRGSFKK
jgi:transcriptional regulator with XRE-family HTH domain